MKRSMHYVSTATAASEKSKRKINTPLMYLETIMASYIPALALNAIDATTLESKNAAVVTLYNHLVYVVDVIARLHECARHPERLSSVMQFCEEQRKLAMDNREKGFNIAEIDAQLVVRTLAGTRTMFGGISAPSLSAPSSSSSLSSEICKRYQSKSCTHKPCKYAHICINSTCHRAPHPAVSCPHKSAAAAAAASIDPASSTNSKQHRRK